VSKRTDPDKSTLGVAFDGRGEVNLLEALPLTVGPLDTGMAVVVASMP
jgi:hypothetical protein